MNQDNKECSKKIAIIALTSGGKELALKLKKEMENTEIYLPKKMKTNNDKYHYYHSIKDLTAKLFKSKEALIYVMALGIVVRMIAPNLQSKKTDPAVITIDETGKNVISTVSGHLGGANKLSRTIAEKIDANAVITTATDCKNLVAIDLLAKRLNCEIVPFSRLKYANSALVNGEKLDIFTDYEVGLKENEQINIYPIKLLNSRFNGLNGKKEKFNIIISNKSLSLNENELQLIPQNIVVGIGCKKNTSSDIISEGLEIILEELELDKKSIKKLATIDLKRNEKGIHAIAEKHGLDIEIINREKIKNVEASLNIKKSEFVKNVTGVYSVAAPAAILSSQKGNLIMDKRKHNGVTFAVYEEEVSNE